MDIPTPDARGIDRGPAGGYYVPGTHRALELLDLFSEGFVHDPYPWLDVLRTHSPVHRDSKTGLWLVSRHRDVSRVLLDPDSFHPSNAQNAVTPLSGAALRLLARAGFRAPPALANNGTSSHLGLRRAVTRFFNAERVSAAVPVIEHTVETLVRGAERQIGADGTFDLFSDFAQLLPCRVLMDQLGIQGVEAATLIQWSDASLELFWGAPTLQRQLKLAEQVAEFYRWLTEILHNAAAQPGSFIAALTAHRLPDGQPLDLATKASACLFVFVAGQSTTGQLISSVLRQALTEPGLWQRAAYEPGLAEAWVEEVLRREPPVTTWRRVAAQPVELGGTHLPRGAQLLLMLMGSGSDPDVFPSPEQMCPHRENIRHHLAFGAGRHRCPGASLARTEAAIALRAVASRLTDIQLVPDKREAPMLGLLSFRAPLSVVIERR